MYYILFKASFPFEKKIYKARTLYHNDSFFTFGGDNDYDNYLSRIASYSPSTNTWSDRGRLLTPRSYAGVIWSQDAFLVVGGGMDDIKSSEKCMFNGDQIECEYQSPTKPDGLSLISLLFFGCTQNPNT